MKYFGVEFFFLMAKMWKFDYSIGETNQPDHSDKVILPESILNDVIMKFGDEKLPHPLIFKISTINSTCFVGVKEFSTDLKLPLDIQKKLGLGPHLVNVHIELTDVVNEEDPFIKIKPITKAGSEELWKSILEARLPQFYTVITSGDRIHLPVGDKEYIFDVLKVKGRNVCVVDKDIELIIDEGGAGAGDGGDKGVVEEVEQSEWPKVFEWNDVSDDSIHKGVKMDKGIKIKFNVKLGECILSDGEFIIGDQFDQFEWCSVKTGLNEEGEKVWVNEFNDRSVSIYSLMPLNIRIGHVGVSLDVPDGQYKCGSCGKFISIGAQMMHESFCRRNNVKCPKAGCNRMFLGEVPDSHWHCCDQWGDSPLTLNIHEYYLHDNGKTECFKCHGVVKDSTNYGMGIHMGLECPMGEHVCMYCHLLLPRGEQSYEARYHGMSEHEWNCGSKTIECEMCSRSIRLRDLVVHMRIHESVKNEQIEPMICVNPLCIRLRGSNSMGFCDICFGPFHSTVYDPDGRLLRGKIERRLILGIKNGCKRRGCLNELCATSDNFKLQGLTRMADIVKYVKEDIDQVQFCVDDSMDVKVRLVEMLDKKWSYGWRCKAVDINGVDLTKIGLWLQRNAPECKL